VEFCKLHYKLFRDKAYLKVYNDFMKDLYPKSSATFIALYGVEGEAYLRDLGITEYNGFSPKSESETSGDFYMSPIVDIKIAGETLPTVKDLLSRIEKGSKLGLGAATMKEALDEINKFRASVEYTKAIDQPAFDKIFLEKQKANLTRSKRKTEEVISSLVTSKMLSKTDWVDSALLVDNVITLDGVQYTIVEEEKRVDL
jgi:hypothetical protein